MQIQGCSRARGVSRQKVGWLALAFSLRDLSVAVGFSAVRGPPCVQIRAATNLRKSWPKCGLACWCVCLRDLGTAVGQTAVRGPSCVQICAATYLRKSWPKCGLACCCVLLARRWHGGRVYCFTFGVLSSSSRDHARNCRISPVDGAFAPFWRHGRACCCTRAVGGSSPRRHAMRGVFFFCLIIPMPRARTL